MPRPLTAPHVQAMAEVMAKAKAFKAARQAQHEEDQGEMDRLDAAYASLLQASPPARQNREQTRLAMTHVCFCSMCQVTQSPGVMHCS